jgi:2-oxoglutarate dehydrogenase E1 component
VSTERAVDASNLAYLEALYQDYQQNPSELPAEWQHYFGTAQSYSYTAPTPNGALAAPEVVPMGLPSDIVEFVLKADRLVQAYRERGHLAARLDPLGRERPKVPELEPAFHGLNPADLQRPLPPAYGTPTLAALVEKLKAQFCGTVGVEIGHLDEPEVRRWIEGRLEELRLRPTPEQQHRIYERLMQATTFEEFLQKKYLGSKTFSLEGTEGLIPLLDLVIEAGARQGVIEVVLGMAHRGRLNVLANVIKKPVRDIFNEFEENFPEGYSGDVKYHLGYSNDIETKFGKVHISLNFNPSHLEFVGAVAMGRVRAKQDRFGDLQRRKGMLLLIHGDAAFIGEGIVQETLNISGLKAYNIGGAVHIILNNQIGFTTEPHEYTGGRYSTDIAKMLESPIFHVNAEDPEAFLGVVEIAMDFRQTFQRDVFIDLIGYRRRGHNETDEPAFTQPEMYRRIAAKPSAYKTYFAELEQTNTLNTAAAEQMAEQYQNALEAEFIKAKTEPTPVRPPTGQGIWRPFGGGLETEATDPETSIGLDQLQGLMNGITSFPEHFKLHSKLGRFVEGRREMGQDRRSLDWAAAEALAFASIAAAGRRVRLTGQDAIRGTFTQRHSGYTDSDSGRRHFPINHLVEGQAMVEIHNSALSEMAVLGFEYGYSLDYPEGLVLWEAQYGDFVNTAQVIIDQFIASAEAKWSRFSGLVLLLPHGMEGGGPEHSSARLERFLQLCAADNIQVCYPTTPSQYFHLLRRQVLRPLRKPLIVMTPKSLLRNPDAVSPIAELSGGQFQRVIASPSSANIDRILLCSGKVYFDLEAARKAGNLHNVAIVRLEQLYPFPQAELEAVLSSYPAQASVYWVQEEPANMGAWWFIRSRFGERIDGRSLYDVCRPESSSPAVGSSKVHKQQQEALIKRALGI